VWTVAQLDLTYNRIGPDGALSLAFSLTRNDTLRRLILRHNLIRDTGCDALCRALASSNTTLIELSLAANGMTDVAARALGRMISTNTALCRLDLSANVFGEVSATYRVAQGIVSYCTLSIRSQIMDQFSKFLPVYSVGNLLLSGMHITPIMSLHYLVKHNCSKTNTIFRCAEGSLINFSAYFT